MSFITRFIRSLRPNRYVGRDLEGNLFYEHPSTTSDPRRTKRTVQYKDAEDVWKYIGGGKRLPVQWSSWLSHTRPLPPTLEELQVDLERQQRVRANVALIEARDQEERAQILRLQATPPGTYHVSQKVAGPQATSQPPSEEPQKVQAASEPPLKPETPLPKMAGSDTYEPEPWAPRARTRGE